MSLNVIPHVTAHLADGSTKSVPANAPRQVCETLDSFERRTQDCMRLGVGLPDDHFIGHNEVRPVKIPPVMANSAAIDQSGVVIFPPKADPPGVTKELTPENQAVKLMGGLNLIRGLNCPFYGNHNIAAKIKGMIEWLDANGHLNTNTTVQIDRAALIMVKEEFDSDAAECNSDRATIAKLKAELAQKDATITGLQKQLYGQSRPGNANPDARNTPDQSRGIIIDFLEALPTGSVATTKDGHLVITIPR